jgi:hypothetical protein
MAAGMPVVSRHLGGAPRQSGHVSTSGISVPEANERIATPDGLVDVRRVQTEGRRADGRAPVSEPLPLENSEEEWIVLGQQRRELDPLGVDAAGGRTTEDMPEHLVAERRLVERAAGGAEEFETVCVGPVRVEEGEFGRLRRWPRREVRAVAAESA